MNADRLINILASVTLVELMLTVGLGATVADVWAVARDWRGVTRALVANYVLVPAAAVGLVFLFRAHPMVAAGVMVVAVCPGAPYGPPFTGIAKGDVPRAVGLMVLLAGSSALLAPLLLQLLLPLVTPAARRGPTPSGSSRRWPWSSFCRCAPALGLRRIAPPWRDGSSGPCRNSAALLGVALIAIVLVAQFRLLSVIRPRGYAGMLALLAASAAAGWLLGGRGAAAQDARDHHLGTQRGRRPGDRRREFPGTPAVTFTTAYAIFQTVLVGRCRRRHRTACRCVGCEPLVPAATIAQKRRAFRVATT